MQAFLVDDVQFLVAEVQLELLVVDRAAFQQLLRRRQPRGDARAYALTQQPLQEAGGLLALPERLGEFFGRLVGDIERRSRSAARGRRTSRAPSLGIGWMSTGILGDQPRVFQCRAPAQHDMADDRIVPLEEGQTVRRRQDVVLELGTDEIVLVGDLAVRQIGDELVVGQSDGVPHMAEDDVGLLGRWHRVAEPLPCLALAGDVHLRR